MSVDTDQQPADESVEDLAETLGTTIAELPAYERFIEAKRAVEQDESLQDAIAEFESHRESYLAKREAGNASKADLLELQERQEELHDRPVMAEYLRAQNHLELRLQAVNMAISDSLEIDFGEKAGGCCAE